MGDYQTVVKYYYMGSHSNFFSSHLAYYFLYLAIFRSLKGKNPGATKFMQTLTTFLPFGLLFVTQNTVWKVTKPLKIMGTLFAQLYIV